MSPFIYENSRKTSLSTEEREAACEVITTTALIIIRRLCWRSRRRQRRQWRFFFPLLSRSFLFFTFDTSLSPLFIISRVSKYFYSTRKKKYALFFNS